MACPDCGRGFQCDAYELPSGDRCIGFAETSYRLALPGLIDTGTLVAVQLCAKHIDVYVDARFPSLFIATPEQIEEGLRIREERQVCTGTINKSSDL